MRTIDNYTNKYIFFKFSSKLGGVEPVSPPLKYGPGMDDRDVVLKGLYGNDPCTLRRNLASFRLVIPDYTTINFWS